MSSEDMREEEFVAEDDAIIGKAFRASLMVFGGIGLIAVALVFALRRDPEPPPRETAPYVPPRAVEAAFAPPAVRFVDVTAASGIDFERSNGATGSKYLPETMGGGCAFFDADSDGDADLFLANGAPWPGDAAADEFLPTQAFYLGDGSGGFEEHTAASGLDVTLQAMGCAVGDTDSDGDPELYVTAVGANRLFDNRGEARFEDVTAASGVAGSDEDWSTSAAFFDADKDGDLDLFVCNYVEWSPEIEEQANYRLTGIGRAYGPPTNFSGVHSLFFRNAGDGTFQDETAAAGFEVTNSATGEAEGKALGVMPLDLYSDGWTDLFVANDTVRNFYYRNAGDGTFAEEGALSGLAYGPGGQATGAMGVDLADYRNDGELALVVGNFANEMTSLYVSQGGSRSFADESIVSGIGSPSRLALAFGVFFFDYDLDGRLDLLQANGHLEDEIHKVQESQQYRQPAQLFWNAGPQARAPFVLVPAEEVGDLSRPIVGRASAHADIDGDGDLDVLLTQSHGAPLLLRNDQPTGHAWLQVRLRDSGGNRDGIGARVELTAGGITQTRYVTTAKSYLAAVAPVASFGLGAETEVESLRVIWPDGEEQAVEVATTNRTVLVER